MFEIIIYEKENGEIPFLEYLQAIPPKLSAKTLRDLDLLKEKGSELREPYTAPIEEGLFELRTKQGSNVSRALFFFIEGNRIIVTHGFLKKQNKTPRKEIEKGKQFKQDWLRRHENEV